MKSWESDDMPNRIFISKCYVSQGSIDDGHSRRGAAVVRVKESTRQQRNAYCAEVICADGGATNRFQRTFPSSFPKSNGGVLTSTTAEGRAGRSPGSYDPRHGPEPVNYLI